MADALVTIAIPAYNAADSVEACLDSCLAQTHRAFELVLVDNNSTDDTVARAQRRVEAAGRSLRVLACAEQGPGPARNVAAAAARGAYVAWVDADDRLHPDKLRAQLEALAPAGDAAAVASSDVVIERRRPGAPPLGLFSLWPPDDELLEALCGRRGVPPVGYLLTRAAVERLAATGGFLPVRCQDREYFNRAHLLGIPFFHVERALAVYRNWSDRQVTNTLDPLLWSPALAACFASLRAAAEREGRSLSAGQQVALDRPWAYLRWRPGRFDAEGRWAFATAAGPRALELSSLQRALALAAGARPVANAEIFAARACQASPSLAPVFDRVLEAVAELVAAGAIEPIEEAEARAWLEQRKPPRR